jgi:uncharacterized coiled-coil protein SlyX
LEGGSPRCCLGEPQQYDQGVRPRRVLVGLALLLSVACGQEDPDNTRQVLRERTAVLREAKAALAETEDRLQEAETKLERATRVRRRLNNQIGQLGNQIQRLQDRIAELTSPVVDGDGNGPCDPSYPTVCIPPHPPDLDCPDVPYTSFTVQPPDPHGFDGYDYDGVGCET